MSARCCFVAFLVLAVLAAPPAASAAPDCRPSCRADVSIRNAKAPKRVLVGRSARFSFEIYNAGPDTAYFPSLTVIYPRPNTLLRGHIPGHCIVEGQPLIGENADSTTCVVGNVGYEQAPVYRTDGRVETETALVVQIPPGEAVAAAHVLRMKRRGLRALELNLALASDTNVFNNTRKIFTRVVKRRARRLS